MAVRVDKRKNWKERVRLRRETRKTMRLMEFIQDDLAEAKGVTIYAIRAAVSRKQVNLKDIRSIAKFILTKYRETTCQLCGQELKKEKENGNGI